MVWQAFTADELSQARTRVAQLQQAQARTGDAWRQVRWTADVIAQARERSRSGTGGGGFLQLRTLLDNDTTDAAAAECPD